MLEFLKRFVPCGDSLPVPDTASLERSKEASELPAIRHAQLEQMLLALTNRQNHFETLLLQMTSASQLERTNTHLFRNVLPNDDAALQKSLMATWRLQSTPVIGQSELMESGFRVFSQNDEDGLLLRLFTHIGHTNKYAVEIGSNCNGSEIGIPENLSTNLIINHGWHGAIFEMDSTECNRMRYFFARDHATRHFHWNRSGENSYFSPLVIEKAVTPANINELLLAANPHPEPDLLVVDIDGGDYYLVESLNVICPRVIVVEFEKRFRDRHSVVQFDRTQFSKLWAQSGTASLPAWEKLLLSRGYVLVSMATCGLNAFFVRSDVAAGKLARISSTEAFDNNPVLSTLPSEFWVEPDASWVAV